MHRLPRIAAVLAASLMVSAALGQAAIGKIGKPAPAFRFEDTETKEIKFLLDEFRGRVVVFYCWRASSAESLELLARMQLIDSQYRDRGIRIVGVCADDKERMDRVLRERGIGYFADNIYRASLFQMVFGSMSHPEVVLIDPYGYIVWRGHPLDNLEERLEDIIEMTPPRSGDTAWLNQRLRQSERHLAQGDFARAYWLAHDVTLLADKASSEFGRADGLTKQIEEAARSRIQAAIEAERAGDFEKAAGLLADISIRMPKTDLVRDVDTEVGRMRGDRNMMVAMRNALNTARGELEMDKAADLEEAGLFDRAAEVYKDLMDDEAYDDTEIPDRAEAALERIETDPNVRERLEQRRAEEQLARWLDLGDRFAKLNLPELAREHYDRVVKKSPSSKWGKRAAERMKSLPPAEVSRGHSGAGG